MFIIRLLAMAIFLVRLILRSKRSHVGMLSKFYVPETRLEKEKAESSKARRKILEFWWMILSRI